jgi:hypothetical protein
MNSIRYRTHLPLTLFALAIFSSSAIAFQTPQPKGVDKIELLSIDYGNGYIEQIKENQDNRGQRCCSCVWDLEETETFR